MRRRLLLLGLLATVAVAAPAPAAAEPAFELSSWRVPVTTPDEEGNPVEIDVDFYLPTGREPSRRERPFVILFHGGGGAKTSAYDTLRARAFARRGYGAMIYSARGHGDSDGETTIAGPAEIRDLFDVAAWAIGLGNRSDPAHKDFRLDRDRIALWGVSQGGLHTNLAQAHANDPALNPYGIAFKALLPGNTPDRTFDALVHNEIVKLSFGAGLLQTYLVGAQGRIGSVVAKWIGTAVADVPGTYGNGPICERGVHDTLVSTMKHDLAERSVGCFAKRITIPTAWAQAFDDELFTSQMAVSMYRRIPAETRRLYLSTGGHGAPSSDQSIERDRLRWQLDFLGHVLRNRPLDSPPVVYWRRDPEVAVPNGPLVWPADAWTRATARRWPPTGTRSVAFGLSADGRAVRADAADPEAVAGSQTLAPLFADAANDPVAKAAAAATPLGASTVESVPSTGSEGLVAAFATPAFRNPRDLLGSSRLDVAFTPGSPDAQLVLKLFDLAPNGTATLLGRDARGLRGAQSGLPTRLRLATTTFAARIHAGHRLLVWLTTADSSFYKPYPGSLGGTIELGPDAVLHVPLRHVRGSD